jgi:hypothetical protein
MNESMYYRGRWLNTYRDGAGLLCKKGAQLVKTPAIFNTAFMVTEVDGTNSLKVLSR